MITAMPQHIRQSILILVIVLMILSCQNVHTFKVVTLKGTSISGSRDNLRIINSNLYAAKKAKKSHPAVPEFSRVLNVGQVCDALA